MTSAPRMRISIIGTHTALENRLALAGHTVFRGSFAADMVLIAETSAARVQAAVAALPSLARRIVVHTCPDLPPLDIPGAISIAWAQVHPELGFFSVQAQDELGYGISELLFQELGYTIIEDRYRAPVHTVYEALLTAREVPEDLLLRLIRELKT